MESWKPLRAPRQWSRAGSPWLVVGERSPKGGAPVCVRAIISLSLARHGRPACLVRPWALRAAAVGVRRPERSGQPWPGRSSESARQKGPPLSTCWPHVARPAIGLGKGLGRGERLLHACDRAAQLVAAADAEGDRVEPVPVQVAHREEAVALGRVWGLGLGLELYRIP